MCVCVCVCVCVREREREREREIICMYIFLCLSDGRGDTYVLTSLQYIFMPACAYVCANNFMFLMIVMTHESLCIEKNNYLKELNIFS